LHSSSDLSPEVVAARNANREANRKKAAAICAKQFLAAGRLKVLEQMSEDAANEDLAVQAKHVLLYLLQLEDGAVLKAAVDGKVQNEVFVWAKGAAGQN
jgi:predicted regulator of Ras-like GTPase activity (Roadblock/LC7/MglB family)